MDEKKKSENQQDKKATLRKRFEGDLSPAEKKRGRNCGARSGNQFGGAR